MAGHARRQTALVEIWYKLDKTQQRVISVWISLITILAEFIEYRTGICIPKEDRLFVKKYLMPPETWTIVASSLGANSWRAKYRHEGLYIGDFASVAEYYDAIATGRESNTQISSFGMGHLFVQVFNCPNVRFVLDFRAAAKASGFVQLWPPKVDFWPFSKGLTIVRPSPSNLGGTPWRKGDFLKMCRVALIWQ